MISWISSCAITIVLTWLFQKQLLSIFSLTFIIAGTILSLLVKRYIRSDYLHLEGVWQILALLPPFSVSMIFFGMIQTWMQRVGFGVSMRVTIVTTLGTILAGLAMSSNLTQVAMVFTVAFCSSVLRERASSGWYLIPVGVVVGTKLVLSW
ncbi:MAG: hypothetical protein NTX15_03970 [Candidatus Kapabacteria bacterium]|nr:hypothetical protein [Candidatus Kapabacteria bacterium]